MAKTIKGINVKIGSETTGLTNALKDVNKKSRDIAGELRKVERLLKFNPRNTELMAQKQELLSKQVGTTRDKLDKLKSVQEEVNEQYKKGEIGEEQYRDFRRELVKTESQLEHYTNQLEQSTSKVQDFGKKMQNLGGKLKDVGTNMKNVGRTLSRTLTTSVIGAGTGLVALSKKAGDAADRILDLKEITGLTTDSIQEWQHVATVAGVETETMTNAVEGLIRKIPQLERESGAASEQLGKLGLSFADLDEMSPDQQVDELISRLSEMEDVTERNAIGSQLFGGAWQDIAPILGMGADEIANARKEAHDLGNVMSEESLNDANDFRIEMDKLKESMGAAARQIGADIAPVLKDTLGPILKDTIIPAMRSLGERIKGVLEWFGNLSPGSQKAVLAIAGIAAAIGPLLVVLGTLASSVGSIIGLFGAGAAAAGAGGTLAAAFAVITGPIGIAVAAIGGLIAAGVLIYKNWDVIKEKATALWEFIKETFQKVKDSIVKPFNDAKDFLSNFSLKDIGKNIINGLSDGIKSKIGDLKDTVTGIGSTIKDKISGVLQIRSPSKVMEELGEYTGEGFALGLEHSMGKINNQALQIGASNGRTVIENKHSGTLTIQGVNDRGQFVDAVKLVMDDLRRENRRGAF